MKGTLSIIIVNWNSKDHLRRCLETVEVTCSEFDPKVIVVDGASFDGSSEMLASEFPTATFIQSHTNIGFGQCNNLGFTEVDTEKVLLLNPDTELRQGSVGSLLRVLDERSDAGIVSPRLLNSDGSLQTSCVQAFPTPLNQALDCDILRKLVPGSRMWGTADAFRSEIPVEVEMLSGACMALRSETFRKMGGFRDDYFMYGEDVDFCFRVRKAGLRNIFDPRAEVIHHGGCSSQNQVSGFSAAMLRLAVETYFKLNVSNAAAFSYRLLQAISAIVRLAFLMLLLLKSSREKRHSVRNSMYKWTTVLKWAIGNELKVLGRVQNGANRVNPSGALEFVEPRIRVE